MNKNISGELFSFYKTVIGSAASQIIALGISFVGSILLARTLGAEARGVVAWVISLTIITMIFSQFGMNFVNRRYVAEEPKRAGSLISMTLVICSMVYVVILPFTLYYGLSHEIGKIHTAAFLIGMPIALIMTITACLSELLVGLHKPRAYNSLSLSLRVSNTLLIILLIGLEWLNPITAVCAVLAACSIQVLATFWHLRKYIEMKITGIKWLLSHTKRYMLAHYIANVSFKGTYAIITILVGSMYSLRDAGWYATCVILTDAIQTMPNMISMYVMPRLVQMDKNNRHSFKKNIMLVTIGLTFVTSIFLYVIGDWLIPLLFGQDFIGAAEVFKTMMIGLVFASILRVYQGFIGGESNGWNITFPPLALIITTLILCPILIPQYGALGAAYVWVIAHFIANILIVYMSQTKRKTVTHPT